LALGIPSDGRDRGDRVGRVSEQHARQDLTHDRCGSAAAIFERGELNSERRGARNHMTTGKSTNRCAKASGSGAPGREHRRHRDDAMPSRHDATRNRVTAVPKNVVHSSLLVGNCCRTPRVHMCV
jgi:hypothetical protein